MFSAFGNFEMNEVKFLATPDQSLKVGCTFPLELFHRFLVAFQGKYTMYPYHRLVFLIGKDVTESFLMLLQTYSRNTHSLLYFTYSRNAHSCIHFMFTQYLWLVSFQRRSICLTYLSPSFQAFVDKQDNRHNLVTLQVVVVPWKNKQGKAIFLEKKTAEGLKTFSWTVNQEFSRQSRFKMEEEESFLRRGLWGKVWRFENTQHVGRSDGAFSILECLSIYFCILRGTAVSNIKYFVAVCSPCILWELVYQQRSEVHNLNTMQMIFENCKHYSYTRR